MGNELSLKGKFAVDSHCTMFLIALSITHMWIRLFKTLTSLNSRHPKNLTHAHTVSHRIIPYTNIHTVLFFVRVMVKISQCIHFCFHCSTCMLRQRHMGYALCSMGRYVADSRYAMPHLAKYATHLKVVYPYRSMWFFQKRSWTQLPHPEVPKAYHRKATLYARV